MTSVLPRGGRARLAVGGIAQIARGIAAAAIAMLTGVSVAYLLDGGMWFVVIALLVALPAFVVVHRVPMAGVALWLLVAPFILATGGAVRYLFYAVHRSLPVGVLLVLVASGMLGIRTRRLPRLGWPEAMMAGYVVAAVLSIAYTSAAGSAASTGLYDRVVVPMMLYLIVRLLGTTEESLRALVPIAAFVVVAQSVIGGLSWIAPEVLPTEWLGRAASRTTGSLESPSVYGVTLIAAGVFLFHASVYERRPAHKTALRVLFALALAMTVLTFTRAVWVAALVAVVSVAVVHPRQFRRLAFVGAPLVVILMMTGTLAAQVDTIEDRFGSDETALSRLPVAYASLRMFEEKPLVGWGVGNFDRFDRSFQREVGGFFPEKDHASHNLYLLLLAEQGIVGFGLFVGPALYWLVRSVSAYRTLPRSGLRSRKLLVLLWAILASHVVVNNFSNMKIEFGLGQWWLVLGVIGALVASTVDPGATVPAARPTAIAGTKW